MRFRLEAVGGRIWDTVEEGFVAVDALPTEILVVLADLGLIRSQNGDLWYDNARDGRIVAAFLNLDYEWRKTTVGCVKSHKGKEGAARDR